MTIEFKLTQTDFRKYFIDLLSQKILLKIILIPPISFFILLQFFEVPFNIGTFFLFWIALMGILMFFFQILPSLVILNRTIRFYRKSKYNCESTSVSFLDQGILLENGNTKEMLHSKSFSIIDNTKSSLLALDEKNHLIIFPKYKFESGLLLGIINLSNQKIIINPFRKNIPPYFLAILCVIPILGGLAGIMTLMFGIFQYKNKILMIIGATGITITVLFFANMIHKGNHAMNSPEVKKTIAEMRMDEIEKDIEKYKKQNGVYPSNLKTLSEDEVYLTDPFMEDDEMTNNKEFVYEITETGYVIYSVGPDKKKGTSDDIFPSQKNIY